MGLHEHRSVILYEMGGLVAECTLLIVAESWIKCDSEWLYHQFWGLHGDLRTDTPTSLQKIEGGYYEFWLMQTDF
jgi:hypothetical protein